MKCILLVLVCLPNWAPGCEAYSDLVHYVEQNAQPFGPNAPEGVSKRAPVFQAHGATGYFLTSNIPLSLFPANYPLSMRPSGSPPRELPRLRTDTPVAPVSYISPVIPADAVNMGTRSLLRFGELADGTPVFLKQAVSRRQPKGFMTEIKSLSLWKAMGVGPQYYGIHTEASGGENLVMSLVPGTRRLGALTEILWRDLETHLSRYSAFGVTAFPDGPQWMKTAEGRLMIIDAHRTSEFWLGEASLWTGNLLSQAQYALIRVRFLTSETQANQTTLIGYLRWLNENNPTAFENLTGIVRNGVALHPTALATALREMGQDISLP